MSEKQEPIVAVKGFDKDLKCRGFAYEIGKTFEHAGKVEACASGFHAVENPMDVFAYYGPIDSRFCIVEMAGEISRHSDDSKIASAKITIKGEIKLPEVISRGVAYILSKIESSKTESNTGNQSAATNTGNRSAATNTGYQSAATVEGKHSVAASLGIQGRAKASEGCAIVLCYRDEDDDGDQYGRIVHIRAGIAGRDVKANTFYSLSGIAACD